MWCVSPKEINATLTTLCDDHSLTVEGDGPGFWSSCFCSQVRCGFLWLNSFVSALGFSTFHVCGFSLSLSLNLCLTDLVVTQFCVIYDGGTLPTVCSHRSLSLSLHELPCSLTLSSFFLTALPVMGYWAPCRLTHTHTHKVPTGCYGCFGEKNPG